MAKLELSYFDFHGGRGEPARIALTAAGIEFEDDRVPVQEWRERKPTMPYGAMPVLYVDGVSVAQCNGINRYCGKLAGLYPEDALQAAICDEVMDAVEDLGEAFGRTLGIEDEEELKQKRQALVDDSIIPYAKALAKRLEERGGEWFADGRFTMADIKVFLWMRHLRSGNVDHVDPEIFDRVAPTLVRHFERAQAQPAIRDYYAERGVG